MKPSTLTSREQHFCHYFTQTLNITEAAKQAGYSVNYAKQLMRQKKIRKYCEQLLQQDLPSTTQLLHQLATITLEKQILEGAVWDSTLPKLDLRAVSKMKVSEGGVEVQFIDRIKALELLLRHAEKTMTGESHPLLEALANAHYTVTNQQSEGD